MIKLGMEELHPPDLEVEVRNNFDDFQYVTNSMIFNMLRIRWFLKYYKFDDF